MGWEIWLGGRRANAPYTVTEIAQFGGKLIFGEGQKQDRAGIA